jgi:hypothetical protein
MRTGFRGAGVPPAIYPHFAHRSKTPARRRRHNTMRIFAELSGPELLRSSATKYFSGVHRVFIMQSWNFFLTSGAHTRKRTIASLRWAGPLLRGENGSRSVCANWQQKGNATHRVKSRKTFPNGALTNGAPRFILPASSGKIVCEARQGPIRCGRKRLFCHSDRSEESLFSWAEHSERFFALLGMTKVGVFPQPVKCDRGRVTLRRKRWLRRPVPSRGRWVRNRRTCMQSRASREIRPRECRRRLPEFPRTLF